MKDTNEIKSIIAGAKRTVFLGGAGVSVPSGIPDFRSAGGLYSEESADDVSPEDILSRGYLYTKPESFYGYYKKNMLHTEARPNGAHLALAELERRGRLSAVITQNIDGLHQAAGSRRVIELHGSVHRNYCTRCGKKFPLGFVTAAPFVPYCDVCGGMVRPDVTMYGESLDGASLDAAIEEIGRADVLIVGGTSLTVYPAAGLVRYFGGDSFIIINRDPTPYDGAADHILRGSIDEVLSELVFGE